MNHEAFSPFEKGDLTAFQRAKLLRKNQPAKPWPNMIL
jgi:hypothetical protein